MNHMEDLFIQPRHTSTQTGAAGLKKNIQASGAVPVTSVDMSDEGGRQLSNSAWDEWRRRWEAELYEQPSNTMPSHHSQHVEHDDDDTNTAYEEEPYRDRADNYRCRDRDPLHRWSEDSFIQIVGGGAGLSRRQKFNRRAPADREHPNHPQSLRAREAARRGPSKISFDVSSSRDYLSAPEEIGYRLRIKITIPTTLCFDFRNLFPSLEFVR
jgi:hypothetical protein